MAPKTRHLAQGKRKRPNRDNRRPRPTQESAVAVSITPAAPVSQPATTTKPVEEERIGLPGVESATPRPDGARRVSTVRTRRPYQAGNRARATSSAEERRPAALPRATEYAFIRSDMRRLLLTAAALTVLMIVLLLVLDR